MIVNSESDYFYEPSYIVVLCVVLGILYILVLAYSIAKVKFNTIGYLLLGSSIVTYLLLGYYEVGFGYYSDGNAPEVTIFYGIGFLELILLSYPYVLLSLAVSLGKKNG